MGPDASLRMHGQLWWKLHTVSCWRRRTRSCTWPRFTICAVCFISGHAEIFDHKFMLFIACPVCLVWEVTFDGFIWLQALQIQLLWGRLLYLSVLWSIFFTSGKSRICIIESFIHTHTHTNMHVSNMHLQEASRDSRSIGVYSLVTLALLCFFFWSHLLLNTCVHTHTHTHLHSSIRVTQVSLLIVYCSQFGTYHLYRASSTFLNASHLIYTDQRKHRWWLMGLWTIKKSRQYQNPKAMKAIRKQSAPVRTD